MAAKKSITQGQRFGHLVVVRELPRHEGNTPRRIFECECDCGRITKAQLFRLLNGRKKSCGCLTGWPNRPVGPQEQHGLTDSRVYRIWRAMKNRCAYSGNENFIRYGAKGIKVCDRWVHSFIAFHEDMGNPPTERHTIDRIDNKGNYEPSNCRWATYKEQAANKKK